MIRSRPSKRVVYLLAVGLVWSSFALNPLLAIAAPWLRGESQKGSALQNVSVADVERILTEDKSQSDAKVARQLAGLELTERMRSAKLKSLEQSVPGKQSRRALLALADASVFLKPAAADVLPDARPDANELRRMLSLTVDYLAKTLPKLPNFYATRTIVRFKYTHHPKHTKAGLRDDPSWRHVGDSKVVVAYRDGNEVINPREWGKHSYNPEDEGLITRGTFGPILSVVFVDASQSGGFTWNGWERRRAGKLAVFRYRVPKEQSHYSVGTLIEEHRTGYHGEMAIDPATGAILRLTVQAEQPLDSTVLQGDIMVEYGPVEIGGKTYTCPVRGVSISMRGIRVMDEYPFTPFPPTADTTLLNDMTFDDYHQFRSEMRILTGAVPASNP